jgi:hypothetical protein
VIERYLVVAGRIRQELGALDRVVNRAERAATAARQRLEDQDLYLDAAARKPLRLPRCLRRGE